MEEIKAKKTEIRRSGFARRNAVPKEERSEKSAAIMERLFDFANFLEARIVLFYMSYGSEVDTQPMIRKALELEKTVALPLVDTRKKQIVLADRGRGVLKTLRSVKPSIKNYKEALRVAFTEIISARAPEARGNGLKFVREVVSTNPIQLLFYSGNAQVSITDSKDLKIENIEKYYSGCLAAITF